MPLPEERKQNQAIDASAARTETANDDITQGVGDVTTVRLLVTRVVCLAFFLFY